MAAHSKIGASSYERWKHCPGSVRLCDGLEQVESSYAQEGTFAHGVAAFELEKGYHYPDDIPAEMRQAIALYKDTVLSDHTEQSFLWIEVRFNLAKIHPDLFGTADAVVYDPNTRLLRVYDFKYGAGIPVEVEDNLQLQYYALGAAMNLKLQVREVELVIVQPRCPHEDGPVRRWKFPIVELVSFASDLAENARATEDPNAPLVAGPHCRFCLAKTARCPEIQKEARALAKLEFKPEWSYSPEQLAKALKFLPVLRSWMKSVQEFAVAEANHGRPPPGFKLVANRPTRRWREEAEAALRAWLPEEQFLTPAALKSPAQVEKNMTRKERLQLARLVSSESKGVSLVPVSDKRPEITNAKLDFLDVGLADLEE